MKKHLLVLVTLSISSVQLYAADIDRDLIGQQLIEAAAIGDQDRVEQLLDAGADASFISFIAQKNPLMEAVKAGHTQVVEILLDAGATNFNGRYPGGITPLMEAASQGNKEIVEMLLESGAERDLVNRQGQTAAQIASDNDYFDIANMISGQFIKSANKR